MTPDGEPTEGRLERLESTLSDLQHRLNRIETRLGMAPRPTPPRFEFQTVSPVPPTEPPRPAPAAPPPPKPSAPAVPDAEVQFGSIVLPRVGAGIVLLGIAYLVGLSIARGWITPWHQFYGALALCMGFIGVGWWKRQEGFEFGPLLIGIGSCGLYLSCAVGHAFHQLFSGEMLVAQFLVISFANLLYGAMAPSRTFAGIGLAGGLVAALLPMREEHVMVSLGLNLAILIPAAAIVAWHRWREMAVGLWLAGMVAVSVPAFFASGPWPTQVFALYAASVAGLLAYSRAHEGWDFDPQAALIPFAAVATAAFGLARFHAPASGWHELGLAAIFGLASFLFVRPEVRNAWRMGGLLVAVVFAPMAQPGTTPIWLYLSLGLAAGLFSFRFEPKAASVFSGIGLLFGLGFYASQIINADSLPLGEELGILTLALAGVVVLAMSAGRRLDQSEAATFLAMAVGAPLATQMAGLLLGRPEFGFSWAQAALLCLLGLSTAGGILAVRRGWKLLAAYAWLAFGVAGLGYYLMAALGGLDLGFEMTVLALMLAVASLSGYAIERSSRSDGGLVLAAFVGWGLVSRMVHLATTQPSVGMSDNAALTLGWTVYALALIAAGFLFDRKELRISSLVIFGGTVGKVLLVDLAAVDQAVRVGLLLLLGGGLIAGGYAYIRRSKSVGGPPAGAAA